MKRWNPMSQMEEDVPDFEALIRQAYGFEGPGFCPGGGWIDDVAVDQWWVIWLECQHGRWRGASRGPFDPSTALASALEAARGAHRPESP